MMVLTNKHVQIVDLKEFVIAVLDVDNKIFVIYMAIEERKKMVIDLIKKIQIKAQSRG